MGQPDGTTPYSPLIPGYRLDRYELLGPLAEGGMASVWIARQRGKHGFEKLVALKTILPQYASDLRFQQMFLDEARIASRIEHFNVARILDLGEEHDVLYLAMEYVDGDSLSKLRRAWQKSKIPAPTGIILRILADVCSGLHEAHEMRGDDGKPLEIVHRDVSPHNILVSVKGVAKLIDFGIAKARDRLAGETNAGVLKGKIQYMAPEQALGRKVDRRADLWAVGATLYHVLTGKPPFDADNTLGTLHLLTSGRPPDPLPPTVHPAIANVARKALSTPAERRFSTAAEMRDAIEAAMVDARVTTSTGDVAAFVVEHLAERTAKRRQTIDFALAAAAERERVVELLKPSIERTDSGVSSVPGRTQAAAPAALRPVTTGITPPGVSTGMDSVALPPPPASHPGRTVLVAGLVGGAIALAGVAGIAVLRSPGVHAESPAPGTGMAASAAMPAAPPAPASADSAAPSSTAP
ncbi:MAG: serine/threonine-protein kinase, partial [Polyangiaceae bacterium]